MAQALALPPVNRRLVLPLLLLTIALLSGLQAQRTESALAMYTPLEGALSARTVTPLFSVRRVPEFLQAPTAERRLTASLLDSVSALPDGTCLVVAEHGRRLYSMDASLAMVPASTQKLLTAMAALLHLGPSTVLTTRVVAEVPVVDGIVDGDVWLVGGGDPLLTTSRYAARFDDPGTYSDLGNIVSGLLTAGVTEITGGIVGDESRYDAIRYLDTWPDRFKPGWSIQSGPLSALSVDDGFEIWDPVNTASTLSVPAGDPAANAASLLDDLLEAEGVVIRRRPDSGRAPSHPGMVTLVELASPPVSLLVRQMLVDSDNTTAELLVKELGRTPAERGTTVAGLGVMLETLENAGHDVAEVVPHDGSGLDPDNRVTCSLLVDVMEDDEHGALLVDALPLAGENGTMKSRFVGTAGEGRVRAKTGTLRQVTSLAGVVDTPAGRRLAFALISNGELPYEIRDLHEDVVLALLTYPAGPAVESLAPRPVVG